MLIYSDFWALDGLLKNVFFFRSKYTEVQARPAFQFVKPSAAVAATKM
jgi:hypothetical protein